MFVIGRIYIGADGAANNIILGALLNFSSGASVWRVWFFVLMGLFSPIKLITVHSGSFALFTVMAAAAPQPGGMGRSAAFSSSITRL